MRVKVVDHDSLWAMAFERERDALCERLAPLTVTIHHIGSTAVSSLAAKPVLDLMLEVERLEALDSVAEKFASLGYEVMGEFGISRRRYYRKGSDTRTHQIHAFQRDDAHVRRHLAFRDYLRERVEVRLEYDALKRRLAAAHPEDIAAYCEGKDAFVKRHEALALKWAAAR